MKTLKVAFTIAEDFLLALRLSESSDRYYYVNPQGYAGAYQFGNSALRMIGYKDAAAAWTGKDGIDSLEKWLGTHWVQDKAIVEYYRYLWASEFPLYNLKSYVGKTVQGVAVTSSGLLAGAHLVGADQVDKFLRLGITAVDPWGTSVVEYMTKFGGYDVSAIIAPTTVRCWVQTFVPGKGWTPSAVPATAPTLVPGESFTHTLSPGQLVVAR